MTRHVYLHSEDLDGWLAPPNHPLLPLYVPVLRALQGLSLESAGERHEIQIVLNSGKAPEYLEEQAARFGGEYVISGNGAAWRRCGEATRRFGPPCPDLAAMRELLGIGPEERDIVSLRIGGREVEVALEDKRDGEGDIVLSFFPEPEPVAHRWRFRGGADRHQLLHYLQGLIDEHGWALSVPPPHADGAVDVLPLVNGRAVGKWTLPHLASELFPGAVVQLTHGGDARNDLSAMEDERVVPLTAFNCRETVETVRARGGVIARREAPAGGAAIECYAELAHREFYGPLSRRVAEICASYAWTAGSGQSETL